MEIDKDKVIEAAKVLLHRKKTSDLLIAQEAESFYPSREEVEKIWNDLEEALTPPTARPQHVRVKKSVLIGLIDILQTERLLKIPPRCIKQ